MTLTSIKLAIGAGITAIIGILFALLKIEKAEKETAETKAEKFKDVATENAKVVEAIKHDQKVKSDIDKLSDGDVFDGLRKYDRSRKD